MPWEDEEEPTPETWEDKFACPICGAECVFPCGPKQAKILILSEFPGEDELKDRALQVGANGMILRQELARCGLDLHSMRLANLWQHPKNDNEECLKHSVANYVLPECKDRMAILLLGSEPVKYFTGHGVMSVAGLEVKSDLISAPILMAAPQASIVFHGGVGGFRLSIQKFARRVKEYE